MNLEYKINKPAAFIFDHLTDMEKFVTIHPVIYKIEKTGERSYKMYERLKFGFIPCSFTYPATVEGNKEALIVFMRAKVMGLVHIEMKFTIVPEGNFSVVKEEVIFKSVLPVKPVMRGIFKTQHALLFRNMEKLHAL